MSIELIKQIAMIFIQWGCGIAVFGIITMLIGLIILGFLDIKTCKAIGKFLNN